MGMYEGMAEANAEDCNTDMTIARNAELNNNIYDMRP
jgi:hypothetical protein